jgi:RimJ/RimL family protein N-acetyltransferase
MDLPYAPLEDRFVRLEPLARAHREGLRAACAADQAIWEAAFPYSMLDEHFDAAWARLKRDAETGAWQPYIVIAGGEVVGQSCLIGVDHANAALEIGATYYRPDVRGGAVNPTAKRLLLARAFSGGARRVQIKVDAINLRSRAAVLKLGAVQEGVLRQDRVTWTGRVRDTVVYSILADEWPAVREGLDRRLRQSETVAHDRHGPPA